MMNVEQTVVEWLNADKSLKDCHASLSVPETRPERFVTVERTGGAETPIRSQATIAVQAWERTRWKASELALLVRSRLETLTELEPVARVDVLSLVHLPDPGPPFMERYQIAIQVTAAR